MAWAPPPSIQQPGVPGVAGLLYAGTLARFVAYILDTILLGIVTTILTAPFANRFAAFDPSRPGAIAAMSPIALIISLGVGALYFIGFWTSGWRATPGMKLLKLQVGDAATGPTLTPGAGSGAGGSASASHPGPGRRPGAGGRWPRLAGSSGARSCSSPTATHPAHQGLHDRFANTAIVQPAGVSSAPLIIGLPDPPRCCSRCSRSSR